MSPPQPSLPKKKKQIMHKIHEYLQFQWVCSLTFNCCNAPFVFLFSCHLKQSNPTGITEFTDVCKESACQIKEKNLIQLSHKFIQLMYKLGKFVCWMHTLNIWSQISWPCYEHRKVSMGILWLPTQNQPGAELCSFPLSNNTAPWKCFTTAN